MKRRGSRVLLVAVLMAAIPSCVSTAGHLPVPETSTAVEVAVSWPTASGKEREFVIEDPKAVERLLAFLRAQNDGWRRPMYTFPSGQYTISITRDKELLVVIWVGADWIGGREGSGGASDNRLRSLSEGKRAELLEILNLPKN